MKFSFIYNYKFYCAITLFWLFSSINVDAKPSDVLKRVFPNSVTDKLLGVQFYEPNSLNELEEVYFAKGKKNLFYATLPFSLNENEINIEVIAPDHSTVKINGHEATLSSSVLDDKNVILAVSKVNIDNNIHVEITSALGLHYEYDVLAQKGIPDLDNLIYDFKERYNIPGISFAIANLNSMKTVYQSGYGYSIQETKTKVLPNHLFRLASMSKQHTAIGILKLVEEGKFGIDDFVFGPEGILKDKFAVVPAKAARITVRNLLEHTSGYRTYPDYMFDGRYAGWSMEQRIKAMLASPQPNEPGTVFAYYNTGFGILGYIIETVSGKSYENYLTDLYKSVGVDDIHVGGTQAQRRQNEAAYYGQNNANAEGLDMNVRAPAGGLVASTEQLIKLLWRMDGNDSIPDLINSDTRQMMFTPSRVGKSRYALGWRANHELFPGSFYHGGTLAGVATLWVYSEGYVVILLCNSRNGSRQFDSDLYRIARDVIWLAQEKNL